MTREEKEEVIKRLKKVKSIIGLSVSEKMSLDMAIEALEQEPCEDAISREPFTDSTICEGISCNECSFNRKDKGGCILEERVMRLPSIQPQPKTGYWILTSDDDCEYCTCSECGYQNGENWMIGSQIKFCQECGAKMIEPQESEDKK